MPMMTKTCAKCSTSKPADDFHRNTARSDGRAVWCKPCTSDYSREWSRRPDVKAKNAARALARYHELGADEKLRIQARRYSLGRHLLTKYGLTLDAYQAMLEQQGGTCAICEKPPRDGRRLAVDHDHACCPGDKSCGACVRGLLCTTCNSWLGFYENESWRTRAQWYLAREIARRKR
jgi:hypothetical protein